jgi:hypothetical protein
MYVTAHLVRSRSGDEGINGFLHHHGADFAWPSDAADLPDTVPGTIVLRRVDLPPGFNQVRAYMDVLAPDGTPRAQIDAAMTAFARDLQERRNPTVFVQGAVTIRFGVELGLERIREPQREMLARVVLALLDEDPPVRPPTA